MPPLFSKKTPTDAGASSDLKSFLKKDLELTRARWKGALGLIRARPKIDEALFEELEAHLLESDVGVAATQSLIAALRKAQRDKRLEDSGELEGELKSALVALLAPLEKPLPREQPKPFVILLAGVNGA
ncbi:MAG: signal recognition particle receptor subunit alpha, partial [Usitatibacter sp.]